MLRASALLTVRTASALRVASASRTSLSLPVSSRIAQQHRWYVHLPASFEELRANVAKWLDQKSQEREGRTILIKFPPTTLDQVKKNDPSELLRSTQQSIRKTHQSIRSRIKKGTKHWRKRGNLFQSRVKKRFHDAWRRTRKQLPSSAASSASQLYKRLRSSASPSQRKKRVTLKEFSKENWFNKDGLPLTSRDPYTGRFVNPWSSESTNGIHPLWEFIQWRWERLFRLPVPSKQPLVPRTPTILHSTATNKNGDDTMSLTWIGHSTCVIKVGGYTLITDPHFSTRAAPVQLPIPFNGVARHVQPACEIDSLPGTIDVCLISHDHYDHLDKGSCLDLVDKVNLWVVPLGIKQFLEEKCGVPSNQIIELEWWEKVVHRLPSKSAPLHLTCAPTQHWSCRTMWDRNTRLWCSFAIESAGSKIYFGGDTGYPTDYPLFQVIGRTLGPFDLAALPIGAYAPAWFMRDSHVNPAEAVQIHKELRAKVSVAIHWGSFRLTEEDDDEPPRLLREAIENASESHDFRVLGLGDTIEMESNKNQQNETRLYSATRRFVSTAVEATTTKKVLTA